MSEEKYRFVAEWFDPTVKIKRTFLLSYYPSDGSVEMYDVNLKRSFLKKMKCDTVNFTDMYVGSTVNILTRQLHITDFGDQATRNKFTRQTEATLAIIKSSGLECMGRIIDVIQANGLTISKGRMMKIPELGSDEAFRDSSLSGHIGVDPVVILELRGDGAVGLWMNLLGFTASEDCKGFQSPRIDLGHLKSHCVGPQDVNSVEKELNIYFPPNGNSHCNTASFKNTTCCIIKPHALREGTAGKIIQAITDAGFSINAFEVMAMDQATASEFLEVYKGVVAEYQEMTAQLVSGPCFALEISSNCGIDTPLEFRKFVGPSNPEIAKHLRPETLRARFGHDKVKNAVHCTDLPEDAVLEIEYLFKILSID